MMPQVSIYRNTKDTKGVVVSLDAVIKRIRDGAKGLDEKTRYANALAQTDREKYRDYKASELPGVTFGGVFMQRKAEKLSIHSGRCVIDIDNCDVGFVMAGLSQLPQTEIAFVSPSAEGVKAVCRVDPVPKDAAEHKIAWAACRDVLEDLLGAVEVDASGSDVSRLCFLAHDPQLIYNPDAIGIEWDPSEFSNEQQASDGEGRVGGTQAMPAVDGSEASTVLEFVPRDLPYEDWRNVGMAIKAEGLPISVWQEWCGGERLSSSGGWIQEDLERFWRSFGGTGVTWATVVHLAKQNGYEPPRSSIRKPVKLQKNVVSMLTETLAKSREFLKSVFENKKIKFFGLRADTGVGKSEAMIAFLLRGFSGLINVPTTDLAKELQARLDNAEIESFRYRGILSDPDGEFPDASPCIHAVRYEAIASRGWNAYELLCESCEVREVCEERGYRAQARSARQAQVTVMPFPDIFLNPAFRSLAKEFLPTYHDDLILHDEFDPYNAFLEINVPKSRLVQLRDDWVGYDPSFFAKELLRILESEGDLSQLRKLVVDLTDAGRDTILEGFISVMWRGQVLSRKDAHRCDDFRRAIGSVEHIKTLPRLETEDWNLLIQLELFFERYPRDADMPMKYENDTLTFLFPPLPMKTRARMGFMSATLQETLFRRAFQTRQEKREDVSFHDSGLTEWHPEARVYQLRTNRNPRATVYHSKEGTDDSLLSASGVGFWELVKADLANPKRGLISYKAVLAEKQTELEGIPTANFGGLVGLDTHFKDVEVLHILFSPEIPPAAVEFKAKALFGDDGLQPLSFERDANGQYTDARVQQCYDAGVISELDQAIGRGRLVSKPVKVFVWCSHYLPGITDREQTEVFDEQDWHEAEGIDRLDDAIANREAFETSAAALTAENSIEDFQEVFGCSYERARQLWHAAGGQEHKDDTHSQQLSHILSMKARGIGERKIASELGISYGKVRSLLKNA